MPEALLFNHGALPHDLICLSRTESSSANGDEIGGISGSLAQFPSRALQNGGLLDPADRLGIHSGARGCPQPGNDKPRFGKKALRFGKSVVCKLITDSEPFKLSFCAWPCSGSFVS